MNKGRLKGFLKRSSSKKAGEVLNTSRSQLIIMTGVMTGQTFKNTTT